MFRPSILVSTTVLVLLCALQLWPQSEKHSTAKDRAKAVEIARSLEVDPLGKQAKDQRAWLILWLINVPDINVKACDSPLGPILDSKKNYGAELFTTMLTSGVAFIIANPDKAKDDVAVYTAGVEGSLRAYESILKLKPKAKWPFLDDLLEKRTKGELTEYVRQAATHCK